MNEEGHNRRCPDMLLSYWGRKDSGQGREWCEVSSRSIQLSVSTTARPLGVKLSCVWWAWEASNSLRPLLLGVNVTLWSGHNVTWHQPLPLSTAKVAGSMPLMVLLPSANNAWHGLLEGPFRRESDSVQWDWAIGAPHMGLGADSSK